MTPQEAKFLLLWLSIKWSVDQDISKVGILIATELRAIHRASMK